MVTYDVSKSIFHMINLLNEDEKWYKSCRNFKPKRSDVEHQGLQNKLKFIKIESQEAEMALRAGKILMKCSIKRSWADLKLILEEVFIKELWINFLVVPRSII